MELASLVWEIVVPTCSYRMGVQVIFFPGSFFANLSHAFGQEMGLGLMVVGKSGVDQVGHLIQRKVLCGLERTTYVACTRSDGPIVL